MNLGRALLAQDKVPAARDSLTEAHKYWQAYDATHRSAGEAAYWLAQGLLAAEAEAEARVELARAVKILSASPLPGDARIVQAAQRQLAQRRTAL
jgi:hypothetical protein